MLIIPAIDIEQGKVVRFVKGRYKKKIYSDDPVEVALRWQNLGAKMLHIVDLEGAKEGRIKNLLCLNKILSKIDIPVEFGGGIRDIATIRRLLKKGVKRIIIGTQAKDERFLKKIFKYFGSKIIVSVDESKGRVFFSGWQDSFEDLDTFSLIEKLKRIGFKEIIYTDILCDGTLKGPNIKRIKEILKKKIKVIACGGISSLEDIQKLKPLEKCGLKGIILGKALYEGRIDLREAIERFQ
jgi:phosphoribosylformimino-5-aminoimidazole carboxamide ribotide isomerase